MRNAICITSDIRHTSAACWLLAAGCWLLTAGLPLLDFPDSQ